VAYFLGHPVYLRAWCRCQTPNILPLLPCQYNVISHVFYLLVFGSLQILLKLLAPQLQVETLRRPQLPHVYSYKAERQSARMSKITNDGLTRSGTGCFIAVSIWRLWASKG